MAKSSHPLWLSYKAMIHRCYRPSAEKYPRYGARGIRVCDAWLDDFWQFVADVGDRPSPAHSLDRKDNDGPYEPSNCRWATNEEQQSNTSRSVRFEIDGSLYSIPQLIEMSGGMSRHSIQHRVDAGMPLADIIRSGPIPHGAYRKPNVSHKKIHPNQ